MNDSGIALNLLTFKKSAKKLHAFFEQRHASHEPLSLSEVQEALARSLGFRSLHGAVQRLGNPSDPRYSTAQSASLQHRARSMFTSPQQFSELLFSLMGSGHFDSQSDYSMWLGRAHNLIQAVATVLECLVDRGDIVFNVETFRDFLVYETLFQASASSTLPPEITRQLSSYFHSLPGFKTTDPQASSAVLELHGYLQMQTTRALNVLALVEQHDLMLKGSKL